ncbi:MAG: hypothetical protein ACLFQP_10660, partial [Halothece sp.]
IVNVNFIGKNDKRIITSEEAMARDQTNWEKVDNMSDEELTQNALDDPDNPLLEEDQPRWQLPAGKLLGVNFFPEEED